MLYSFVVTVGNEDKAGRVGAKIVAVQWLGREGQGGDGATMKVILGYNYLGLIAWHPFDGVSPLACKLNRSLHRFHTGVHWEGCLIAR